MADERPLKGRRGRPLSIAATAGRALTSVLSGQDGAAYSELSRLEGRQLVHVADAARQLEQCARDILRARDTDWKSVIADEELGT